MTYLSPKSAIAGIKWPAMPADKTAQKMAMQFQLDQSQWWSPERLQAQQLLQARAVLKYAIQNAPWYRQQLGAAGINPDRINDWDAWRGIPVLGRTDVQQAGAELNCSRLPSGHGKIGETSTTGSTARPVVIRTTNVTRFLWQVYTLREHLWHQRDFSGKLATIRYLEDKDIGRPPEGAINKGWGPSTDDLYTTGPCVILNIRSTIAEQAAWLVRESPDYLLTYPTLVLELANYFAGSGELLPNLKEVRTFGEVITPEIRAACKQTWNVPLVDTYSSQEVGYMAFQCPEHEHYHIQSENVVLEVLDDEGRQCRPGETGRVVVTALHNFASPLIRYEIGDYAMVGDTCSCGRGLPVLNRVHGRTRNMLHMPDGGKRWPVIGEDVRGLDDLPALRQYQLVQKSLELIEVRLVMPRKLTPEEEKIFIAMLQRTLGHPFEIQIVYRDVIERSSGGKFEEFLSELK